MDAKGNLLATTRSVVEVGVDPHSVVEDDQLKWKTLSTYLGITEEEILKAVNKKLVHHCLTPKFREMLDG